MKNGPQPLELEAVFRRTPGYSRSKLALLALQCASEGRDLIV
jgi:hypothetical protein